MLAPSLIIPLFHRHFSKISLFPYFPSTFTVFSSFLILLFPFYIPPLNFLLFFSSLLPPNLYPTSAQSPSRPPSTLAITHPILSLLYLSSCPFSSRLLLPLCHPFPPCLLCLHPFIIIAIHPSPFFFIILFPLIPFPGSSLLPPISYFSNSSCFLFSRSLSSYHFTLYFSILPPLLRHPSSLPTFFRPLLLPLYDFFLSFLVMLLPPHPFSVARAQGVVCCKPSCG